MKRTPLDTHAAARRYEEKLRAQGYHKYRRIGRNSKRTRERRERDFGPKAEWIRGLRCCACGAAPPSDPHHHPTRAAGGTAKDMIPLCRDCHNFAHSRGPETFERVFALNLKQVAKQYEAEWSEEAA